MAKKEEKALPSILTLSDIENKMRIASSVIVDDKKTRTQRDRFKVKEMQIQSLSASIAERVNDNKGMMELLPDLKLARRILVSSTLSPKDLSTVSLRLINEEFSDEVEFPTELLDAINDHFKSTFNLEEKMTEILEECLFDVGSYVYAFIPENELTKLNTPDIVPQKVTKTGKGAINYRAGLENYDSFIRYNTDQLGSVGIITANAILDLDVTDAYNYLKVKGAHRKAIGRSIVDSIGMESIVADGLYAFNSDVKADDKYIRNPLVMKLPSDSIIPVHVPGDPTDHLGYYVLTNAGDGTPVSRIKGSDQMDGIRKSLEKLETGGALAGLFKEAGISISKKDSSVNVNAFFDDYCEYVENQLRKQLVNGKYGEEVEVTRPQNVYMLMLSRSLAKRKTRLVYLPKEMVSYFAFRYDEHGIGVSLLEEVKLYASLRAIMMFANIWASVKDSVGGTRLNITLDEDDPEPEVTVDTILSKYADMTASKLPIGLLNSSDIAEAIKKASIDVSIDGGEAFPRTSTNVEDTSRSRVRPDSELMENLRRMMYSGLEIPPEIVDSTLNSELATLVISRNQLFSKQVMDRQAAFSRMLSECIRSYIRLSSELLTTIQTKFNEAKIDVNPETVNSYIDSIAVTLPAPDISKIENQLEAYQKYSEAIDIMVQAYVTEEAIGDLMSGDIDSRKLESIRLSVGNMLRREWLRNQNILPELDEAFSSSKDNDTVDRIEDFTVRIVRMIGDLASKLGKAELKAKDKIDKSLTPPEEPATTEGDNAEGGGDAATDDTTTDGNVDEGTDAAAAGDADTGADAEGGEEPPAKEGGDDTNNDEEDFLNG